jgi:hypothetical protein
MTLNMLLYTYNGRQTQPLVVGGAQEFVDTEDFILAMKKFAKHSGNVDNMFIDFENTHIPVAHASEFRVIAQMAAAYQNACLAQNLSSQKDLYHNTYESRECIDDIDSCRNDSIDNKQEYSTVKVKKSFIKNKKSKYPAHESSKTKKSDATWDEEMHGEQVVYDVNYEMNEDLVPWLMNPGAWEEKYGLY